MGIPGLLPFVRKACYEGNLSEFEGKTLLVDASCLLHRGLFGCATKMALGQDTEFYVGYVRKYVNFLLAQKCHVILVFDGRPLPAKKDCNDSRREMRKGYQQLGEQLMRQGLTSEADRAFTRGTEITREVVEKTIKSFNKIDEKVDVIVAPYEADAQIAYLIQQGLAHAVVTEDSDMIVYGCDKIIFKMNPANGACLIYDKQKLANCLCPVLRRRFQFSTFRRICILAGCDYFQGGLQGVGLKGAEDIFAKTNQPDLKTLLPRLPLYLNKRLRAKIDRTFIGDFIKAENTFLYQIVFDPIRKQQVPLNPHPLNDQENSPSKLITGSKFPYAGCILPPQKAVRLALGNGENRLHLPTLEDCFTLPSAVPEWSIWHGKYKTLVQRAEEERENRLTERFGAFRPTKSPVKRPAATKLEQLHSQTMPSLSSTDVKEMEDQLDSRVKRRKRLSEIQLSPMSTKNGAYAKWSCEDWLRKYGVGTTTAGDENNKENCKNDTGNTERTWGTCNEMDKK